ncbi:MAG: InlB B-repeat-containing protein, partial [Treponema sp.]|nr:InlB B-repeat-containing protein [Treponema sp.]
MNSFKKFVNLNYLILIVFIFIACENPFINQVLQPKTITFESNGGTRVENQTLFKGELIERPSDPDKPGYTFSGWFQDNHSFLNRWDFNTEPHEDMTLYANWELILILDPSGSLDFSAEFMGADIDPRLVTITNLSSQNTDELNITVSGENANLFSVSPNMIANIEPKSDASFTVIPETIAGLNAGTYHAVVTITNANNIFKTLNVTLTVTRAAPVVTTWPSGMTAIYGQSLNQVTIPANGVSVQPGTFSWTTPGTLVGSAGTRSHNMTFTADSENFSSLTNNVDVAVGSSPIMSAALNVTAPISGEEPVRTAPTTEADSNFFASEVSWNPNHAVFNANFLYTAAVTLTVTGNNHTFTGGLTTATINGFNAAVEIAPNGLTATLSYEFPETAATFVSGIEIFTQPELIYSHGDSLNLAAIVVRLLYNDGSSRNVAYNDFSTNHITTSMSNGTQLRLANHNNQRITVTFNDGRTDVPPAYRPLTIQTNPLTINPRELTIIGVTAVNRTYNAANTVELNGGTLQNILPEDIGTIGFTLGFGTMVNPWVSNNKQVTTNITLSGTGASNYWLRQPENVTVNITPAPLTITGASTSKPFDGNNEIAGGINLTLSGWFGNDAASTSPGTVTAVYTGVNAGTNTVNITNVTLTGQRANEYTVTPVDNFSVTGGITQADGAAVDAPTWDSSQITHNSITVNPVTAITGQSVEYAISTTAAPTILIWQNNRTFRELFEARTYFVFARAAANNNFYAGPVSPASLPITMSRIDFNSNGGSFEPPYQMALNGNRIQVPNNPTKRGYYLVGWFTDNNTFNIEWDFDVNVVNSNTTLYAKWNPNPNVTIHFQGGGLAVSGDVVIFLEGGIRRPTSATLTLQNPHEYSPPIRWYYGSNGFYHMTTLHLDSLNPLFNTT